MSRIGDWINKKLGVHVHTRKVFCVGEIAFVKCVECGDESLPWLVPVATATAWKKGNPNAIDELIAIDKRRLPSIS